MKSFDSNIGRTLLAACFIVTLAHAEMMRLDSQEVVMDTHRQLMWQDNDESIGVKKSWKEAITYCRNLDLAGYHDWRLPYIEELFFIRDERRMDVAIHNSFHKTKKEDYWSSSDVYDGDYGWKMSFMDGNDDVVPKSSNLLVRCIRGDTVK